MLTLRVGSEVLDQRFCSLSQALCYTSLRSRGGGNSPCSSDPVLSLGFAAARFKVPSPAVLAWTMETISSGSLQLDPA